MKGYLTVAEAAERKSVTPAAIYAAIKDGRLESVKMLGRIALKEKDVDAYVPLPKDARKGVRYSRRPGPTGQRQGAAE